MSIGLNKGGNASLGREVFGSEEFKTLCRKFGVDLDQPIIEIKLVIPLEGAMTVETKTMPRKPILPQGVER